jgi:hypothetical protein
MLRDSTQCTLEPVPKSELASTYIYSVPDNSAPIVSNFETSPTQPDDYQPRLTVIDQPRQPHLLRRWPFLVLYGFLIAVVAGLAGGYIGDHLASSRTQHGAVAEQACPDHKSPNGDSNATSTLPSSTTPPNPSSTFFSRTLAVPTTGCTPPTQQRSFKSVTLYLATPYTTYCATGWLNDELFALSAATPSDCIEACVMYNGHKTAQDRTCVGGGFIPEWWNQSKAMTESGGMPYNCFLKSNDTGTARNDKTIEVVSLCLGGACGDVLGK